MTTLQDEIDALPKVEDPEDYCGPVELERAKLEAALARLALTRKGLAAVIEYLDADSSDAPSDLLDDLYAINKALEVGP